ncbi:hypothetical protein D3C72_1359370 [compost metagenome]
MRARTYLAQHLDDITDVIVEIEGPIARCHHAGIDPIGNVNIGRRQQRLHGAAQQGRIMAGHRRHQQHLRLRLAGRIDLFFEMDEIAERTRPDGLFSNGNGLSIDNSRGKAEFRFDITARQAFENLEAGIEASSEGRAGKRVHRIVAGLAHHIGTGAQRRHGRMVHFIKMVEH